MGLLQYIPQAYTKIAERGIKCLRSIRTGNIAVVEHADIETLVNNVIDRWAHGNIFCTCCNFGIFYICTIDHGFTVVQREIQFKVQVVVQLRTSKQAEWKTEVVRPRSIFKN